MTSTWSEIEQARRAQQSRTKDIIVPIAGLQATFQYREIPQIDQDQISDLVQVEAPKRKRGEPTVNMNTGAVKWAKWKAGVVSGPDGFSVHNRAHYETVPAAIRDEILDAIDAFDDMPDEVMKCFRGSGAEGEIDTVAGQTGHEVPR